MGSSVLRLPIIVGVGGLRERDVTMDMQAQSVRDRFGRYGPLIMWMLLISFASTNEFSALNTSKVIRPLLIWLYPQISEEGIRLAHFITRKLAHFAEYSILGFLAARAFFFSSRRLLQQLWFGAAMLLIMLYALIDEYHQSFVPSRSASLVDSAIDIAGGVTALVVFACLHRRSDASST